MVKMTFCQKMLQQVCLLFRDQAKYMLSFQLVSHRVHALTGCNGAFPASTFLVQWRDGVAMHSQIHTREAHICAQMPQPYQSNTRRLLMRVLQTKAQAAFVKNHHEMYRLQKRYISAHTTNLHVHSYQCTISISLILSMQPPYSQNLRSQRQALHIALKEIELLSFNMELVEKLVKPS